MKKVLKSMVSSRLKVLADMFGVIAILTGIFTCTAHNIAFGLMIFALVGADYWDEKSEQEELHRRINRFK